MVRQKEEAQRLAEEEAQRLAEEEAQRLADEEAARVAEELAQLQAKAGNLWKYQDLSCY